MSCALQLLDEAQQVRGDIKDPRDLREELQRAAENLDARQDDAARHNRCACMPPADCKSWLPRHMCALVCASCQPLWLHLFPQTVGSQVMMRLSWSGSCSCMIWGRALSASSLQQAHTHAGSNTGPACRALREADNAAAAKRQEFERLRPQLEQFDAIMRRLQQEYESSMQCAPYHQPPALGLRSWLPYTEPAVGSDFFLRLSWLQQPLGPMLRPDQGVVGMSLTAECCAERARRCTMMPTSATERLRTRSMLGRSWAACSGTSPASCTMLVCSHHVSASLNDSAEGEAG